jgi:spore germination cell wall hydrolase CwlJ-like protein
VLKRSLYLYDPFELTIEEKIFRAVKITCVVFACVALVLSALDMMGVKSIQSASAYIRTHRIAEIPHTLHMQLTAAASAEPSPYAAVEIPRGHIALSRVTRDAKMRAVLERDLSPVDALADVPYLDAVEVAFDAPPVPALATPQRSIRDQVTPGKTTSGAPTSPPVASSMRLASLNPADTPPIKSIEPPPIPLPPVITVLPRAAPPLSPAQRLNLVGKDRQRAEACLARAIYFEARNQPYRGQVAVAQVVMNRVFSGIYPHDVCGVIYQNAHRRFACQFTFACDGKPDVVTERRSWYRARRIARQTLDGKLYVQAVGTATHYHATYVHPYWVREMHRYAREGIHLFYRPIAWGNGSDEPIWSRAELASSKSYKRQR